LKTEYEQHLSREFITHDYLFMALFFSLVISHGATFKEIESDWAWLTKYLLVTLGTQH